MRSRLAAITLPAAGLAYLVLMSVLAYYHAPGPAQWAAGIGGGLALIGLAIRDRRQAKRQVITDIREAIDPQPRQEAPAPYASAQD